MNLSQQACVKEGKPLSECHIVKKKHGNRANLIITFLHTDRRIKKIQNHLFDSFFLLSDDFGEQNEQKKSGKITPKVN